MLSVRQRRTKSVTAISKLIARRFSGRGRNFRSLPFFGDFRLRAFPVFLKKFFFSVTFHCFLRLQGVTINREECKMKKINDKILELSNEDLDMVVGGVFNQIFIQQNNLKVFTGKSGAQGLRVRIHSSDPLVRAVMGHDVSFMGTSSEKTLRTQFSKADVSSIDILDNNGKWVNFPPDKAKALLG